MAKTTPIQTNFTGGEISPRLLGRVDLEKYSSSCELIQNFVVFPHGGMTKRSGTRFIAETKASDDRIRLIPFVFSTEQAYILEFGDQYVRFYRNEGQIYSGASPYEISTPYGLDDLADLDFTQSADILYLVHKDYQMRKLSRTGHTTWTLTTLQHEDGPYNDLNTTSTTIQPSAKVGNITLTASAALFASTDVGRVLRMEHGAKWGACYITGFTSSTQVNATVFEDHGFDAATAVTTWRLGTWNDADGWPTAVTFYQERLFFANSTSKPNTIWGSVAGDFEDFSPTNVDGELLDDSAITITLATDQVNAIRWMYGAKQLQVGTSDGTFIVSSGRDDLALTPTNVTANRETRDGTADERVAGASKSTLYIDRNRRKVREFAYTIDIDGYASPDLTLIAEHISAGQSMQEIAYARVPDSLVWVRLSDGSLRCLTYERAQDVVSWSRHFIGGTDVKVTSIAVIPNSTESQDQLYLIVSRTINGSTAHYVEFLEESFDTVSGDTVDDAFFVDSGLTYSGAAANTVSGLDHLEGETVQVLADGATHPDVTVSSGQITLDRSAETIHIGLPYVAKAITLDPEVATEEGPSQGKTRRMERVTIRVVDTFNLKAGAETSTLEIIPFRNPAMPMGSIELFSGDKRLLLQHQPERKFNLVLQHDVPQPCTILAIMYAIVVSER